MKRPLLILLLLLTKPIYDQYLDINTINCSIGENEQKKINKLLNYERMFYNEIFQTTDNISVPIKINLYGKLKEFKALKNTYQVFKQSDGFYSPSINEVFVYKNSDFITVCLHEASHCLFESNFKKAPRWLNEGLAEFFETFDFDANGDLYAYPQEGRLKSIKAGIALNDSTRLKTFFKINGNSFYKEEIGDNYNTAYSVIFYFIKSKNSAALKNIISLTKMGKTTEDAIELTFGSFATFEERYKNFYYLYPTK